MKKKRLLSLKHAEKNIRAVYAESLEEHKIQRRIWYQDAHDYCNQLAVLYNTDTWRVIAGLAVMSPNCSWSVNKRAIEELLATDTVRGNVYPANIIKARYFLSTEHCNIDKLRVKGYRGNKVKAFFDNILIPERSERVTVDSHAIRAAFNLAVLSEKHMNWVFGTLTGYSLIEQAYKNVAHDLGMVPCKLQAIVWLATKHSLAQ